MFREARGPKRNRERAFSLAFPVASRLALSFI
jgi:hypothetical protein